MRTKSSVAVSLKQAVFRQIVLAKIEPVKLSKAQPLATVYEGKAIDFFMFFKETNYK